jgi:hypothetical protein
VGSGGGQPFVSDFGLDRLLVPTEDTSTKASRAPRVGLLLVAGLLTLLLAGCADSKEALVRLVADYSYLGVFLFLIACGLGFPSPEEVALIGGGYAVHQAHPAPEGWPWLLLMITVAMLGVLVGDASACTRRRCGSSGATSRRSA